MRRTSLFGCAALAWLSLFTSLLAAQPAPRKVALLVGVNRYDRRGLEDLKYAERDVEELAQVLRASDFEVRLLKGSAAGGDRATRDNIRSALNGLLKRANKQDVVLVALAGHGQQIAVRDQAEAYFCPVDAVKNAPQTLLGLSELVQALDREGGINLVLVGACRDDSNPDRSRGIDGNAATRLPVNTALFLSCSARQRSFESERAGGGHGVFFHFVLEGLRGGAADRHGEVTWDRLVPYVRERFREEFAELVPTALQQRPHVLTNLSDDLVLTTKSTGSAIMQPSGRPAGPEIEGELREYVKSLNATGSSRRFLMSRAKARVGAWRAAAEGGVASAQILYASCLGNGVEVEKDEVEAVKWLRKAAEQGYAVAQSNLGFYYLNGLGVEQDAAEAVKWFRKAAEQKGASGQFWLGACYVDGRGVEKDEVEGVKWLRKAAEQEEVRAQVALGCCYVDGRGVEMDKAEGVKWLRKATEQGYAVAQATLGECYLNGLGVEQDAAEAVKWFRKAAEQKDASGQFWLGACYVDGRGVEKDEVEGVKWLRKAAEQEEVRAQALLGVCYADGLGVEKDRAEAVKWFRKAAAKGEPRAQALLGVCYADGLGVDRDAAEAVKWLRKAAEQKDPGGQFGLGYCYQNGLGVNFDLDEAVRWYRRAAAQGHDGAREALNRLNR